MIRTVTVMWLSEFNHGGHRVVILNISQLSHINRTPEQWSIAKFSTLVPAFSATTNICLIHQNTIRSCILLYIRNAHICPSDYLRLSIGRCIDYSLYMSLFFEICHNSVITLYMLPGQPDINVVDKCIPLKLKCGRGSSYGYHDWDCGHAWWLWLWLWLWLGLWQEQ